MFFSENGLVFMAKSVNLRFQ